MFSASARPLPQKSLKVEKSALMFVLHRLQSHSKKNILQVIYTVAEKSLTCIIIIATIIIPSIV